MKVNGFVQCLDFPWPGDTRPGRLSHPGSRARPAAVKILLISEGRPRKPRRLLLRRSRCPVCRTSLLAFQEAGQR